MASESFPTRIYQLKITLKDSRPPIWRRVQVSGDITLAKLHRVIQEAMGWLDGHLHQFVVGKTHYGVRDQEDLHEIKNEKKFRLSQVISKPNDKLLYEYDFGDGWEHEILFEKILEPGAGSRYPVCIAGKRACPPEDCGGTVGYAEFLEAIRNPTHERHEEMLDWIGRSFDPEAFDLDKINQMLKRIR